MNEECFGDFDAFHAAAGTAFGPFTATLGPGASKLPHPSTHLSLLATNGYYTLSSTTERIET
jgi:hypothetical protein